VVAAHPTIGAGAVLVGSVVGDDAALGADCEVRNLAVVGPGATLGSRNALDHGLRISADQTIPDEALTFS
jgi:UDP-3-O-[3-hydroxymyristoyl] glucosamine N-acyltransferase